jgi:hypothetical protein
MPTGQQQAFALELRARQNLAEPATDRVSVGRALLRGRAAQEVIDRLQSPFVVMG